MKYRVFQLVLALLASIFTLIVAAHAHAHDRSTSASSWRIEGELTRVRLRVTALDLSRSPERLLDRDRDSALRAYVQQRLTLHAGKNACAVANDSWQRRDAGEGWLELSWQLRCGVGRRSVSSSLLLDVKPGHVHFARLRSESGELIEEVVLNESNRVEPLEPGSSRHPSSSFGDLLTLGVEHIWSGADHLVFVLVLLLSATRLRQLLLLVTGFTLGHSVTLALAALGVVNPDGARIEALIGLSVVLAAIEVMYLRERPRALAWLVFATLAGAGLVAALARQSWPFDLLGAALFAGCYFALPQPRGDELRAPRAAVAALFGLLHGFGFAGALTDLQVESPRLVTALLGFNLGVELGQLAVVAVAWPLYRGWTRLRPSHAPSLQQTGAALATALGTHWFLTRLPL